MARGAVRGPRAVSSIRGLAGAQARAAAWHRRDYSRTTQVDAVCKGQGHAGSTPATSTMLRPLGYAWHGHASFVAKQGALRSSPERSMGRLYPSSQIAARCRAYTRSACPQIRGDRSLALPRGAALSSDRCTTSISFAAFRNHTTPTWVAPPTFGAGSQPTTRAEVHILPDTGPGV